MRYTLVRTNINSCDFSSGSYTYVDEGDKELESFSIDHDKQFKIPLIKRALDATDGKLTLFASPWSPPAFMKDNNNMLRGGKLLPEFYQSWATIIQSLSRVMRKKAYLSGASQSRMSQWQHKDGNHVSISLRKRGIFLRIISD